MDFYGILGVGRDATADEIKKAYRAVANKNHPDHGGDVDAFKIITLAGETLTDPEKRKRYDETGETGATRDSMVADLIAGMLLPAFSQDHRDPIRVISDQIDAMRSSHRKTVRDLQEGIEKLTKKIARFGELNANSKNLAARNMILEVLRGHIELAQAQIEESQKKVEFGTKALAYLNDLKCPPGGYSSSVRTQAYGMVAQWEIRSS